MRDLDILVGKDDATKAAHALELIGYRFEDGFNPNDYHLPLAWLPGAPSAVELHTEALSFAARNILSTEDVWRHANRHFNGIGSFLTLPNEWQLLVGVLHHQISDRGHARQILALKALWEFASLGQELTVTGWQAITDHMASYNQEDVLGSFLAQASQLFGLRFPPSIVISREARAHAESTFRRARWPYPVRRVLFLGDQLRFGFSDETMKTRYGADPSGSRAGRLFRHLSFLTNYYRGSVLRRLTGRGDNVS